AGGVYRFDVGVPALADDVLSAGDQDAGTVSHALMLADVRRWRATQAVRTSVSRETLIEFLHKLPKETSQPRGGAGTSFITQGTEYDGYSSSSSASESSSPSMMPSTSSS